MDFRRLSMVAAFTAISLGCFCSMPALAQTNTSCDQTSLLSLVPCQPYLAPGNTTKPGSDCCQPLTSILNTQPSCLCQVVTLARDTNTPINPTRASQVASACNLTIPNDVSSCLASAESPSGSVSSPGPIAGSSPGESAGVTVSPSSLIAGAILALISAFLAF